MTMRKSWRNRSAFNIATIAKQQQFAHAAAILVLTPEGKMARYLYGVRFQPRDVRFALAEASVKIAPP